MSLLLAGEKKITHAHDYFYKDSNALRIVEFYALCSKACPMFGQFSMHCSISHYRSTPPTLLRLLLKLLSNRFFSSLYQIAHQ